MFQSEVPVLNRVFGADTRRNSLIDECLAALGRKV